MNNGDPVVDIVSDPTDPTDPSGPTASNEWVPRGFLPDLIESLTDAIVVIDRIGHIIFANHGVATQLGWAPDDLLGRPVTHIVPHLLNHDHQAVLPRSPSRMPAVRADGSEVEAEILVSSWSATAPGSGRTAPGSPGTVPTPRADGCPAAVAVIRTVNGDETHVLEPDRRRHVVDELLDILAEGSSTEPVETRLLARLGQTLGWEVTSLWRLQPATGELHHRALWRQSDDQFDRFCSVTESTTFAQGEGLPGRVVQSGRPAWIADLARDDNFPRASPAAADGLHSGLAFPVQAKGRLVGVIEMFSVSHREPDEDLLAVMTNVGRHLGDFLAQADQAQERERLLSELEQTRRSREFLLRASRVLAEATAFRETLERLATMAVPILGDLCLIDILVDGGGLERVVARHASPDRQHLADQLRDLFPPDPQGQHPSVEVIRSGKSAWAADMSPDFLRRTTRDDGHLALVTELGFTSYMSVPLTASGRVLGSVTLVAAGSGRHFAESDLALAEELAQQVAAVIDRARVYDLEHQVARTLQGSLLPDHLPSVAGLTVAARYLPSTAGAEVGGDWYDVIPIGPGRIGLVVGDVVGHDVAAASVMGQLRNALRAYALCDSEPGMVLRGLGEFHERLDLERMATVLYGVLELPTGLLTVASAGHPPPLLIPDCDDPWFIDVDPGPLLGVGPLAYPDCRVMMGEGDLLVLYTDGLIEDRATNIEHGMQRLLSIATPLGREADAVCQALMRPREAGARRGDDVAILAVQRDGPPGR